MTTYEEFLSLIPSEFVGKPKLNSVLHACAIQFDEISNVLYDTNLKTLLETAVGDNLDYIGSILSLTRKEAFDIMKSVDTAEIDDETYRRCLKFKLIKNNGSANYEDVMKSIDLLWGGINKTYLEDASAPATFTLELDDVDVDEVDPAKTLPLVLKGNGIKAKVKNIFYHRHDLVDQEKFGNETLYGNIFWFYDGVASYNGVKDYNYIYEEVEL